MNCECVHDVGEDHGGDEAGRLVDQTFSDQMSEGWTFTVKL